jgi:hypothetical protein
MSLILQGPWINDKFRLTCCSLNAELTAALTRDYRRGSNCSSARCACAEPCCVAVPVSCIMYTCAGVGINTVFLRASRKVPLPINRKARIQLRDIYHMHSTVRALGPLQCTVQHLGLPGTCINIIQALQWQ